MRRNIHYIWRHPHCSLIFRVLSILRTLFGPCKSPHCLFLLQVTVVSRNVTRRSLLRFARNVIFCRTTAISEQSCICVHMGDCCSLPLSIHLSIYLSICSSIFLSWISFRVRLYRRPFARALTTERQARAVRKMRERDSL